ncbi:MAG: hypothetical protein JOY71_04375, partial [Acetobacteraceae bacterium]|nr:hypothetical protein [Acetobacteraceae bacterium]
LLSSPKTLCIAASTNCWRKADLFNFLQQRWKTLFQAEFEVLLYDLTSTYFEWDPRPVWLQPGQAAGLRAGGTPEQR